MSDPNYDDDEPIVVDSLTGVVAPELPGMPQPPEPDEEDRPNYLKVFDAASGAVAVALDSVRQSLAHLRAQREEINEHIRQLVGEERRLNSMVHIANKKADS